MTYRVQPYADAEVSRCAFCGKRLRVRFPDYVRLLADGVDPANAIAKQRESDFSTNRRVVHRQMERGWRYVGQDRVRYGNPDRYDRGDDRPIERVPLYVRLTFATERREDWGADGTFCTKDCGLAFAHAALRAGYRTRHARRGGPAVRDRDHPGTGRSMTLLLAHLPLLALCCLVWFFLAHS